jgi:heme/copper-type cytochrome/quinol oxidase subunit 3
MKVRPVLDVSQLPTYGFGPQMTPWWGTLAFCVLEGTGFALVVGAYLYAAWLNPEWPLSVPPPGLVWSSLLTALLVASLWPNYLANINGKTQDLPKARWWLVVMSVIGLAALALRAGEFTTLYVRWDTNAYGSLLWIILGLHTVHIATDVADTIVLTALMFTRHAKGKRFSDVEDNAFYWNFVVLAWVPLYLLLYWFPRM